MKKIYFMATALLLILFLFVSGCIQSDNVVIDLEVKPGLPDEKIEEGVISKIKDDECGNEPGNANEIIPGPSGHEGDYNIDNPFRSLTIHPENPDIVLVGTERNGFLKSTDGGLSWTRHRKGIRHDKPVEGAPPSELGYPEIYDIAMSESNPDIIYAATTGGPGPLAGEYGDDGGMYKSTDGGKTWKRRNCGLGNSWVWSVHISPDNPDEVVIGIAGGEVSGWGLPISGEYYEGGIFRTTDGGDNWNRVDVGTYDNVSAYRIIASARSNPSLLIVSGFNMIDGSKSLGFAKSMDGGKTWETFANELKVQGIDYFDISSDGSVIYAAASNIYKILKSEDGGNSWGEYAIGTSGYAIAVSPSDPRRVLFSKAHGVFLSTDGLKTEKQVIELTTSGHEHVSDMVFAPSDNNIVYVITSGSYNLYESNDGGVVS
ncbi:MAG: hypothetical protein V3R93_03200 [Candidatus Hydrothermarchaeaceae archaeon]